MKKIVLVMLLSACAAAVAQTAAAPAPAQPAAPQKKEIKDQAEYTAYVGAVQQTDPAAKVSGLEAFLTQYPNSVMKEDALELLMGAYDATKNTAKMLDTAQKLLAVNPCNIRGLALVTYSKQSMNNAQALTEAGQTAQKGLDCWQTVTKPEGVSAADWDQLKKTTTGIFDNAAGMSAYNAKDYGKAEQFLKAGVQGDPSNLTETYYLGLADLQTGAAENDPEGIFYIARAASLQTGEGKAKIAAFGKSRYTKYHGSDKGWDDVLALAATQATPPADIAQKITKYVPPTPAEQAAALMASKKVEEMSFAEWQMVLSEGTPEDADKVWTELKGKPLQMQAHIISIDTPEKPTSPTRLHLAGSSDDIDAKRADIDLTMGAAIPAKEMPKEDTDFQFQGTPDSYVAKPFVMTMKDGALLVTSKPKPTPTHKKTGAH
jgi:hypothetical protein